MRYLEMLSSLKCTECLLIFQSWCTFQIAKSALSFRKIELLCSQLLFSVSQDLSYGSVDSSLTYTD